MFVAWRDLRFAKGRFALMATVVVLMTLLVALLSGLTAGLAKQSTSAITGLPADHLAFSATGQNESPTFTQSTVSQQQWQEWAQVPGVTAANPLGITSTKASADGTSAALTAFGVQPSSDLAPEGGQIVPGQVVLSTEAAETLSAHAGQTVTLAGHKLQVTAVAGEASFSHTPVVWTSLTDWQQLDPGNPSGEHATVIALSATDSADIAAADQRLSGTEAMSLSDSLSAIPSFTAENGSLQMMRGLLFAISALVIGAFFTVWTIQRSGDIAILKALGASTGYLLRDALGQAVVLLVGGTAIGTALAAALGAAVSGVVPFILSVSTVLVPMVVMIALGMLGAALAVRRITSVDPLAALSAR